MGTDRVNNGSSTWDNGHCTIANGLRIGVGDGSSDSQDWALFFFGPGNGRGDMSGYNVNNFGGEFETHNGYSSEVSIYGLQV